MRDKLEWIEKCVRSGEMKKGTDYRQILKGLTVKGQR